MIYSGVRHVGQHQPLWEGDTPMERQQAIEMRDRMNALQNGLEYEVGLRATPSPKTLPNSPYFVYVERDGRPPKKVARIRFIDSH